MSKERDQIIFNVLKEICENTYNRPTEFDERRLEEISGASVMEVSHSLNNLQREGLIRIHIGATEKLSKVELLKSPVRP
jgi:DNA-binding GntR family transcriptional regulator